MRLYIYVYIYIYMYVYILWPPPSAAGPAWMLNVLWKHLISMRFCFFFAVGYPTGGGNYGIFSPWCGCPKGRHYRVFGSGFESKSLYSGDPGGHFGTLGLIWVTRGCPGGSKRHPLEPQEVFNQFWVALGSLLKTTLGSFS